MIFATKDMNNFLCKVGKLRLLKQSDVNWIICKPVFEIVTHSPIKTIERLASDVKSSANAQVGLLD